MLARTLCQLATFLALSDYVAQVHNTAPRFVRERVNTCVGSQLRVKYRHRTELPKPSIGVRTSSNSGHDIYQPAQCCLVPLTAVSSCNKKRSQNFYSMPSSVQNAWVPATWPDAALITE